MYKVTVSSHLGCKTPKGGYTLVTLPRSVTPYREAACTHTHTHTHTHAPAVEFFTRTGITAAGGQFDFDRYTRMMFVHRNGKRNLLVLLYLRRKYKKCERQCWIHPMLAQISLHAFDFSILSLYLSLVLSHKQGLICMGSINVATS
jgi:hypothetical protein